MRKFATKLPVLIGLTAIMATACTAAPAPAPANPPPKLPADSIAYDYLSVQTNRKQPFAGDCSQIDSNSQLKQALGFTGNISPNPPNPECYGDTAQGNLTVEAIGPTDRSPDPWSPAWHGPVIAYFRRIILLDRYYAAYATIVSMGGPGCDLTINTGSKTVLQVSFRDPSVDPNSIDQFNRKQLADLGQKYCPIVQHAAEQLMQAIDPKGGSLALN